MSGLASALKAVRPRLQLQIYGPKPRVLDTFLPFGANYKR